MKQIRATALLLPICFCVSLCVLVPACDSRSALDRRLYYALQIGDTNYLQRYLSSGGDIDRCIRLDAYVIASAPLLDVALENGQVATVQFLLRHGANPNRRNSAGDTPLTWAIWYTKSEVSQTARNQSIFDLLQAGADPNMRSGATFGWTPLICAAMVGQSQTLNMLLAAHADVNGTDDSGWTALHAAKNAEVAKLLIAAGANVRAVAGGEKPADSATRKRRYDVLAVLTNQLNSTSQPNKGVPP